MPLLPLLFPLIVSRTRHQAPTIPDRLSEGRLLGHGFRPSIDQSGADGPILRPRRDQSPVEIVEVVLSITVTTDDRNLLGRRNVVAGSDGGRVRESEDLDEEFGGEFGRRSDRT